MWHDQATAPPLPWGRGRRGAAGEGPLPRHTDAPDSASASGDIKERTTAEHGPSIVRVPEDDLHLRLEPCSAVVTGVLGVHRDDPGRLAECPTAAGFLS